MAFGRFHFCKLAGCLRIAGTELQGKFQLGNGFFAAGGHAQHRAQIHVRVKRVGMLFDGGVDSRKAASVSPAGV